MKYIPELFEKVLADNGGRIKSVKTVLYIGYEKSSVAPYICQDKNGKMLRFKNVRKLNEKK